MLYRSPSATRAAVLSILCAGCSLDEQLGTESSPLSVENAAWQLELSTAFDHPHAAHFNARDGLLYVGRRSGTTNGLYRINANGTALKIANGTDVAGVAISANGDIWSSEDQGGGVFKKLFGNTTQTTRQQWLSGLANNDPTGGDDDPTGLAFAPAGYTGPMLVPGEGIVVDRGVGGPDDIWRWSTAAINSEQIVHVDDGTLVDAVDVAVTGDAIYVADAAGAIYSLDADGRLAMQAWSSAFQSPVGIAPDPLGGLLVIDASLDGLFAVDVESGEVVTLVTGFSFTASNWGGVDTSTDGTNVFVTDAGANVIYTFYRDPNQPPVASCQPRVVSANLSCQGDVSVDAGSFDPDDDSFTVVQEPAGPYPLGETAVTLTVTDSAGESSECTATVTVEDKMVPTISCPKSAVIECDGAACGEFVPETTGASDNCGPVDVEFPGPACFPIGTTDLVYTATDAAGNTTSCTSTLTVADTVAPSIECPPNVTLECDGKRCAQYTPRAAVASDSCGAAHVDGPDAGVCYALGTSKLVYEASDDAGNASQCSTIVTVVDTEGPEIEVPAFPAGGTLRPPDGSYRTVGLDDCHIEVNDACEGDVDLSSAEITCVSSDEPDDAKGTRDGRTTNDIVIVDDTTVKLRAERNRFGDGRVYTIAFAVRDAAGNAARGECHVTVEASGWCERHQRFHRHNHDRDHRTKGGGGTAPAIDSGAAQTICR